MRIADRPAKRRGFTLIELLIVIAIILVIAVIAKPRLDKALMHAREMSAIEHIKTVHAVQAQYYSQFGRYAAKLEELGPPTGGQPGPAAADLIPGDLAKGVKSGYQFILAGGPQGYAFNANPTVYNSTGRRSFFSDQTLVIRENYGPEPATATSSEIK